MTRPKKVADVYESQKLSSCGND